MPTPCKECHLRRDARFPMIAMFIIVTETTLVIRSKKLKGKRENFPDPENFRIQDLSRSLFTRKTPLVMVKSDPRGTERSLAHTYRAIFYNSQD